MFPFLETKHILQVSSSQTCGISYRETIIDIVTITPHNSIIDRIIQYILGWEDIKIIVVNHVTFYDTLTDHYMVRSLCGVTLGNDINTRVHQQYQK